VDLVEAYAALLPVTVISEILGVPVSMRTQFLDWGNQAAAALDIGLDYREYRDSERGIRSLNLWMYEHIERLRRDPGDDLLSQLITVEDGGARLSDVELMATAGLLLAAGFETTVNLIGSGAQLLLTHPDQLELLRGDPSLWPNAVDEILRLESPVQNTARYAGADTEICGLPIPKSAFVAVLIGGANRDPEVFADPDRFDVRRANAREHLAFSAGVHYCIGAALARAEGRIGLQVLFERYPELAPAGTPTRRGTRTLRGYQTLPVRPGRSRLMTNR
jgi:cytochrome P450